MNKKHKDISTYFVSNKRSRGDTDKSDSEPLTTDNFNNSNNNDLEIHNNKVSTAESSLSVNQNCNTTINLSVNDDDIGLYVSNKLVMKDFHDAEKKFSRSAQKKFDPPPPNKNPADVPGKM
jgi:hypothetical protein